MGILTGQPPFQYINAETGEFAGINVDLLRYFAQENGFRLNFQPAASIDELYQLVEDGKVDMIAGMPYHYELAENRGISMTRNFLSTQYILVMNKSMNEESLKGHKLAMSKTSTYQGEYVGNVVWYDNEDACVRAVNRGEADYTYLDAYTAQYYINQAEFSKLKLVPQTYQERQICYGISRQHPRELLTILNKSIMAIPAEDMQAIFYKNTIPSQSANVSLRYILQERPLETVLVISAVFLIIVALLSIILYQRVKSDKKASLDLEKHLRLYSIANEVFFEYDCKKHLLLLSTPNHTRPGHNDVLKVEMDDKNDNEQNGLSKKAFLDVICSGGDRVREEYLYCNDGKQHWLRFTLEAIQDESKQNAYVIGKIEMIDQERERKEDLVKRAELDSLTHVLNAETTRNRIESNMEALKEDECGALLIVDIDRFKSVNDTYGHMKGDQVLIDVAAFLASASGTEAIVGRPGGDEFIVYLKKVADIKELEDTCAMLQTKAHEITVIQDEIITISIGAALSSADTVYQTVYQAADAALYEAKRAGRDQFVVATLGQ